MSSDKDIVIVGAGICGLATALALHRKGLNSLVLEKAESLRATGGAIGIHTNGWRALDQLGVGNKLRQKAIPILMSRNISLDNGVTQEIPSSEDEYRVVKRGDIIITLSANLPKDSIRFGCEIISIKMDPHSSWPIIELHNGKLIKAQVVIGCDGVNSVVAKWVGLKGSRPYSRCEIGGFVNYPNGHGYGNEFIQMKKGCLNLGRIPIDDKLVSWFFGRAWVQDSWNLKDPELIRKSVLESMKGFPTEMMEMVQNSDPDSLTHVRLKYRAPWDVLLGNLHKETVTVAGDAMHVMAPFLGQGGSAGLEDAVVLARCMAQEMHMVCRGKQGKKERIEIAINRYMKERRMRVVKLSTQTYLTGLIIESPSPLMKLIILFLLFIFFGNSIHGHTQYDCGRL